jgi:hypothetical protein
LYGSEGMEKVDFSEYLKSLVNSLERSYLHKNDIEIIIDVVDVSLDIDQAITCGLILNELISNSLKHAFPKNIISGDSSKSDILIGLKGKDISEYAENSSIETVNSDINSLTTPLISITACSNEGKIIINVADNGAGLPNGINFENTESLGLQIVSTLVSQLEGTINLDNDSGARFIIEFEEKKL